MTRAAIIIRADSKRVYGLRSVRADSVRGMLRLDIQELCKREGIENAHQLANVAELSYAVVWRIWNGRPSQIGLATLERLCDVLKVLPGQLFSYTPEPGKPRRKRKRSK